MENTAFFDIFITPQKGLKVLKLLTFSRFYKEKSSAKYRGLCLQSEMGNLIGIAHFHINVVFLGQTYAIIY